MRGTVDGDVCGNVEVKADYEVQKVMFDCNTFSKLLQLSDWQEFLAKARAKYELCVASIQVEELAQIPDSKKETRIQHIFCLCEMKATIVPTAVVLGYGRLGFCAFADENDTTYEELLNESKNNIHDAMIGDAAKREGCLLITNDDRFAKKLRRNGIETMSFEEFNTAICQD